MLNVRKENARALTLKTKRTVNTGGDRRTEYDFSTETVSPPARKHDDRAKLRAADHSCI